MRAQRKVKEARTRVEPEEQVIRDIFHSLNQPLTTLHCCIELCISDVNLAAKHRNDLRIALRQIDAICDLTAQLERVVNRARGADGKRFSNREPAVPLAWLSRCCG